MHNNSKSHWSSLFFDNQRSPKIFYIEYQLRADLAIIFCVFDARSLIILRRYTDHNPDRRHYVAVDRAMYTLLEDFTREAAISRTRRRLHNRSVNDEARKPGATIDARYWFASWFPLTRLRARGSPQDAVNVGHVFAQNCKRHWSISCLPQLHDRRCTSWGRIPPRWRLP